MMTELEQKIKAFADDYYNGNEQITDKEYDNLIAQLRVETPDSPLLDAICGEDKHIDGFKKGTHYLITGTLAKLRDEQELCEWFGKHPGTYFVEFKVDGAGLELKYQNGQLIEAVTRGDGDNGDIITDNIRKIATVPQQLKDQFTGSIRGEVILYHNNFKKFFSDKANPRNATAGCMKHLDGSDCEKLNFIAYDVKDPAGIIDASEQQKLDFLQQNGFVIPAYKVFSDVESILNWRAEIAAKRDSIDYDIDGIVLKSAVSNPADLMNHTPKFSQVALKFDLAAAITKVIAISWSLSGTYMTPVAEVEPVYLDGTTVVHANLFNCSIMRDLGVKVGSTVVVVKKGQIIPYIEKVL